MSDRPLIPSKITDEHLHRRAVVYVRQSTCHQVRFNKESQRLQIGLVDRAQALGWPDAEVIDVDLGVSACAGSVRPGFDKMLAAVARGEVGIVLAREVSRLSRNDRDFCQLVELCQVFGTLLGDDEQVYDPAAADDQLILGIKGTLSVAELRVLRTRLLQGAQAKAQRGELRRLLPPGYVYDEAGQVALDPDERVRHAVAHIFEVFRQAGSLRQAMLRLQAEGVEVPARRRSGNRAQIHWQLANGSTVAAFLRHPWYAGAYTYGRRQTEHSYEDGRLRRRQGPQRPPEQCRVLLWDHHPGYITRAQFEEHQRMIAANDARHNDRSAVRTGGALLAGLLRCGRCGRRMHVRYWNRAGRPGRYMCDGSYLAGGLYCLGVPGRCMDDAVSAELLRVLSPLGLQASLAAVERCGDEQVGQRKALSLQVEQHQYEVRLAQERYEQVDARNRLVAGELERHWNAKLEQLALARQNLEAVTMDPPTSADEQRQAMQWLGEHFATVWSSAHCPVELKKRLARAVIDEIVVDSTETRVSMVIHWQGGAHTLLETDRPQWRTAQCNSADDIEVIRQLAPRYSDDQIGRVLSRMGRLTGKGKGWTREAVKSARNKAGIPGGDHPKVDPDLLSLGAAARHAAVSDTTLRKLVGAGLLTNQQTIPWAPWELRRQDLDGEPVAGILEHLRKTGRLALNPVRSEIPAEQLTLFQAGSNDG
ncbi:MAG: recombinase family protein [Myxococcota bacterium]